MLSVKLTAQQLAFLRQWALAPPELRLSLSISGFAGAKEASVEMSEQLARDLGDALTGELALVGFDENYGLTPQGRMLEDLIDRVSGL